MIRFARAVCSLLALTGLGTAACQTAGPPVPAMLESADDMTLARIKAVLAEAVGRADIRLGPEDLTSMSSVSVLPPRPGPHETHSTAMPTVFDLVTNGKTCMLVRRESGKSYRLDDVACRAAAE